VAQNYKGSYKNTSCVLAVHPTLAGRHQ